MCVCLTVCMCVYVFLRACVTNAHTELHSAKQYYETKICEILEVEMMQKNTKLAITKLQNYKIQQKWAKLLFNIVYYHEILLNFVKFCTVSSRS
jgi:hypothetical protein